VNTRIKEPYDNNLLIKQSLTLITHKLYYINNSHFVNIIFGYTVIVSSYNLFTQNYLYFYVNKDIYL